jgi:hypothetical protein
MLNSEHGEIELCPDRQNHACLQLLIERISSPSARSHLLVASCDDPK